MSDQTYCDRLVQDTPFLTSNGRLSEQQVDKIILQLNRFYPQILTNKEAEKFRNPKTSVRVRLSDLLTHLQRKGERDCQEFYRALYINAQHLYGSLPSRKAMREGDRRAFRHWDCERAGDVSPESVLGSIQVMPEFVAESYLVILHLKSNLSNRNGPHALPPVARLLWHEDIAEEKETSDSTELDPDKEKYNLNDRGPMFFLACFSVAAGLAFLFYYCSPDPRVLRGTRRVIGFSPIIIGKHVSHYLLAYLEKSFGEP